MKRIIFAAVVVLTALTSCQKNNAPEIKTSGIPVTLIATIGGHDTRISYEDEENVLKAAWEAGDKLSVFTLDENYNILSNDIFTAAAAGRTAEFEGVFTDDPKGAYVYVYYPALTEGEGTQLDRWKVPATNTYDKQGTLCGPYAGAPYIEYNCSSQLQKQQSDCSHLKDLTVLQGQMELGDMQSGDFTVDLHHMSYVIRVDFVLPDEDLTIYNLQIYAKPQGAELNSVESVPVSNSGWTNIYDVEKSIGGRTSFFRLCYGEDVDSGTGTGLALEGTSVTGYIVGYAASYWNHNKAVNEYFNMSEGDYFYLEASVYNGVEWYDCATTHTFTKDVTFENGKMYRLSATLEAEQ